MEKAITSYIITWIPSGLLIKRVGLFSAHFCFRPSFVFGHPLRPTFYYINYMYVLHEYWIVYYFILFYYF